MIAFFAIFSLLVNLVSPYPLGPRYHATYGNHPSVVKSASADCLRLLIPFCYPLSSRAQAHFVTELSWSPSPCHGCQLLHFTRNRFTGRPVREFLCLGSWTHHNLVTLDEILVAIRQEKRKRDESGAATA
ncbi:hypothetical protein JVU11DRAFT_9300 [Chiua virens]|nr:hypothetical protein JVU11DRAFT_9300 [Chiua virens]